MSLRFTLRLSSVASMFTLIFSLRLNNNYRREDIPKLFRMFYITYMFFVEMGTKFLHFNGDSAPSFDLT